MPKTSNISTKQDLRILKEELKEELTSFRDEVMTGLDGVMKELETMREESTLGAFQTRSLKEEVDDHEKRITKLELTSS